MVQTFFTMKSLKVFLPILSLHRSELEGNWANMKAGKPLDKIPPLE